MQTGRSVDHPAPVIFDGQGRLCFQDIVVDSEGIHDHNGPLNRVKRTDFELIRELGSGQYGTVWAVRHLPTGSMMAIKVVALSVSETALKQILTELDILMRASSPFIVKCFGAFCSEASVYFCMELVEEGSVEKLFERLRPPPSQIGPVLQAIAFAVVSGLCFLRDTFSVIHRDIKPSNILVGRDGSIKICDFGVSGYLAQSLARTRVGTSNYMAPERISLGGNELGSGYGVKADIWSLGATLMELSVGAPPFPLAKYDCIFAQLMDIIYSDPPRMPQDRGFSSEMTDFIDSCLRKDPNDRPSYVQLMSHPFIKDMTLDRSKAIIMEWIDDGNCF
jgi:mitogen-activated protein kinase kinase